MLILLRITHMKNKKRKMKDGLRKNKDESREEEGKVSGGVINERSTHSFNKEWTY